eukprot:757694-Hanusia_phi.AAC.1
MPPEAGPQRLSAAGHAWAALRKVRQTVRSSDSRSFRLRRGAATARLQLLVQLLDSGKICGLGCPDNLH